LTRVGLGRRGTYTAGRLLAVVTRPRAHFVANNWLQRDAAEDLAVAILASAIAVAATAADPHRQYYMRHFADKPPALGFSFYSYVSAFVLLLVLGSVVVVGMSLRSTLLVSLAAAAVLYFCSEKLADEHLRLRLFERDLPGWGRAMITRSVLQLAGLGLLALLMRESSPAWAAVGVLALGNLFAFVPQLPRLPLRRLADPRMTRRLFGRGVRLLRRSSAPWTFALLSAGIGYVDRLFALVGDKAVLPVFMLVVMCFSIVQMAVEFYYVTPRRRDFLDQTMSVSDAFANRKFAAILCAGLACATAAAVVVLAFSRNGRDFPVVYMGLIAALQCAFAMVAIPQQILYWKDRLAQMVRMELAFWVLLLAAAPLAWYSVGTLGALLSAAVVCAFARLALFTYAAHKTSAIRRAVV
jgi:hypothetical protein